jgi:hypothetical protein
METVTEMQQHGLLRNNIFINIIYIKKETL